MQIVQPFCDLIKTNFNTGGETQLGTIQPLLNQVKHRFYQVLTFCPNNKCIIASNSTMHDKNVEWMKIHRKHSNILFSDNRYH